MKTRALFTYFFALLLILIIGLSAGLYFFDFEKKQALQHTISQQQKIALALIGDQIYTDLLIDNTLEVERKLNKMIENLTIQSYRIFKSGDGGRVASDYLCETVYFDRANKIGEWGKLCLKFVSGSLGESTLNLRRVTLVVIFLSLFFIAIIFGIFRKISQLNKNLHEGVRRSLDSNGVYEFESDFWEPILGQLRTESNKKRIAENQLLQKQVLEEKFLIAQKVSHDIRSPISVLNLIQDGIQFKDSERRELFYHAISRINEIANDLLANTKTAYSSNSISQSTLPHANDIKSLVEAIIAEKRITVAKHNLEIEFAPNVDQVRANCDPAEFKRVISNILNNAIESIDKDFGKVSVEMTFIKDKVQISIADNGKGIPEGILSKVGTKGFSYGKEGMANSGNGLGLFHARQAIESFGGRLEVSSKLGIGTTVMIELVC